MSTKIPNKETIDVIKKDIDYLRNEIDCILQCSQIEKDSEIVKKRRE